MYTLETYKLHNKTSFEVIKLTLLRAGKKLILIKVSNNRRWQKNVDCHKLCIILSYVPR